MINCTFEDGGKASLRHLVLDVLVLKNNKILLVKRNKKLIEGGKWALPGGYLDRDETIREGLRREVFEETGWRVEKVELLRIVDNPERPNDAGRQNVAMIYICEAILQEGKSDWEVDETKWFDFDQLPPKEKIAFDHYENIKYYIKNK